MTNTEQISLSAIDAARLLGISARSLWTLTKSGRVPHLRLGGRVTYPADALREWANAQAKAAVAMNGGD